MESIDFCGAQFSTNGWTSCIEFDGPLVNGRVTVFIIGLYTYYQPQIYFTFKPIIIIFILIYFIFKSNIIVFISNNIIFKFIYLYSYLLLLYSYLFIYYLY